MGLKIKEKHISFVKKTTVKFLVKFFQLLNFLKKVFSWLVRVFFVQPLKYLGLFFYRFGGKFLILKLYQLYHRIKIFFFRRFLYIKNKFLYIFGSRYLIHFLIIFLALFVAVFNLQASAQENNINKLEQKSLLGKLVQSGEFSRSDGVIQEPLSVNNVVPKNTFYTEEEKYSLAYNPGGEAEAGGEELNQRARQEYYPQRKKIIYYTVKKGETVSSIARRFNVTVNTIIWANGLNRYGFIKPGQKLKILPTTGVLYRVRRGDTLGKIARRYQVSVADILKHNNVSPTSLRVGEEIVIPGARKIYSSYSSYSSASRRHYTPRRVVAYAPTRHISSLRRHSDSHTHLFWPNSCHVITQYFYWRHHGLDIACPWGSPIRAAADGVVEKAGWTWVGYGKRILINHGGGLETLYGHLSKILVHPGEAVNRGQIIGLEGSTGHSTGPHLHFEVRIHHIRVNPLNYLR